MYYAHIAHLSSICIPLYIYALSTSHYVHSVPLIICTQYLLLYALMQYLPLYALGPSHYMHSELLAAQINVKLRSFSYYMDLSVYIIIIRCIINNYDAMCYIKMITIIL